jgi:EpsI family protein
MHRRITWQVAALLFIISATVMASKWIGFRSGQPLEQPLDTIPWHIGKFSGSAGPALDPDVLAQLRADSYLVRNYQNGRLAANLFIAFYESQRAGESMHSPKHCLPGAGWEIWDYGSTGIPWNGRPATINKYSIYRGGDRRLVLYWYQSKTTIIANEYLGKFLLARDALLRNSTAGSIVRIIVPDTAGALDQARQFAIALVPYVERCFGSPLTAGLPVIE